MSLLLALLGAAPPAADDPETRQLTLGEFADEIAEEEWFQPQFIEESLDVLQVLFEELAESVEEADEFVAHIIEDAAAAADDPETRMLAQFDEELELQPDGFEDGSSAFVPEEEPEPAVVSEWIIRARRRGRR